MFVLLFQNIWMVMKLLYHEILEQNKKLNLGLD